MKKILFGLLVALAVFAGCVAAPQTSVQEQAICRDDPDRCPGGHPITNQQYTINDVYDTAGYNSLTVTTTPAAYCDATSCHASASLGGSSFIRTTCFDFVGVAWCDHERCDEEEDNSWVCNDLPPLE